MAELSGNYNSKYKYNVYVHSHAISGRLMDWANKNLESEWGWWFKRSQPYIHQPSENDKAYLSCSSLSDYKKIVWEVLKHGN
jgi:hypothetical protein